MLNSSDWLKLNRNSSCNKAKLINPLKPNFVSVKNSVLPHDEHYVSKRRLEQRSLLPHTHTAFKRFTGLRTLAAICLAPADKRQGKKSLPEWCSCSSGRHMITQLQRIKPLEHEIRLNNIQKFIFLSPYTHCVSVTKTNRLVPET